MAVSAIRLRARGLARTKQQKGPSKLVELGSATLTPCEMLPMGRVDGRGVEEVYEHFGSEMFASIAHRLTIPSLYDFRTRGIDCLPEVLPEILQRKKEIRLRRPHGTTHRLCNLLVRQLLVDAQYERHPLSIRELPNRRLHELFDFPSGKPLDRREALVHEVIRQLVRSPFTCRDPVQARVDRDTINPS